MPDRHEIPTIGGSVVDITLPGPSGGQPSWHCRRCNVGEERFGDDAEVLTLVSAGRHAARCGRDAAAVLDAEIDAVKAEGLRVDPKAATHLGVAGILASAGFAGVLAGAGRHLSTPAVVAGAVTAVLVLAAVVLLLLAGQARLNGGDFGFMAYANDDAEGIVTRLTSPQSPLTSLHKARELRWRSRLLHSKYQRIRWAVPLLIAGFLGAAVTAALVVWTG